MLPDTRKITWLASYPKSGNTWTRTFLTNYLCEAAEEADINELFGGPLAASRVMFDQLVGMSSACLLAHEIEALRPAVYRHLAAHADRMPFMKVHDAWRLLSDRREMFPEEATYGVVYIVRNPLDVAASWQHHFGATLASAVSSLCDPGFELSTFRNDRAAVLLPQPLGTWSEHVLSWLHKSRLKVHLMRYEDLVADPEREFSAMLRFVGIEVSSSRVAAAVEQSSFARLQRQEEAKGFRERRLGATAPFFRRGKVGAWRNELNDEQVDDLLHAHSAVMHELGYLDGAGQPVF